MLDFKKLSAPKNHGEVLVAPAFSSWASACETNAQSLRSSAKLVLGVPLAEWRRRTRASIVDDPDRLVVACGHQPEFIHPGVWAKHVAVARMAEAVDGVAINVIVDSDHLKHPAISVPVIRGEGLSVSHIPFTDAPPELAYEQLDVWSKPEVGRLSATLREALGDRYDGSGMPAYFDAIETAGDPRDWVEQHTIGRSAIEHLYGVRLNDIRISRHWCTPLATDMILNASAFASAYNRALASYRKANRVRGVARPIPDLVQNGGRCEVALWALGRHQPRQRLFVERRSNDVYLWAGDREIGVLPVRAMESGDDGSCEILGRFLREAGGWELRPRALALTMWARLLLADLFVHGIGGAKYDRISDAIMEDYYGMRPPYMTCVSATLHMILPNPSTSVETVGGFRHRLRDYEFNPQRHIEWDREVASLVDRRRQAVDQSLRLRSGVRRDRRARRRVFDEIRSLNKELADLNPQKREAMLAGLEKATTEESQRRIATGREYFFGIHGRAALQDLVAALPAVDEFRV